MEQNTFERIKEILQRILNVKTEDVHLSDELVKDLGMDSIDSMEIVMGIEDEFALEIFEADMNNINTVLSLVEMVNRKREKNG